MSKGTPTAREFVLDLMRPHRTKLVIGSLVLVASTLVMLSLPFFLKNIFDTALQSKDPAQLAWFSLAMMGAVVVLVALTMLRTHFIFATAGMLAPEVRQHLMAHVLKLDMAWFERTSPGEVVSRVHDDVRQITESIIVILPVLVRGTLLGLGSLVMLVLASMKLTALLLLAGIPIGLVGWWLGRQIKVFSRAQQDTLGHVSGLVTEASGMIQAVRMFGQEQHVMEGLTQLTNRYAVYVVRKAYLTAALIGINIFIGFTALVGVLWLGGLEVMHGTMTMGNMLAFLLYLSFLADAVSNFNNFWPAWQGVTASADRILDFLKTRPTVLQPAKPKALPKLGARKARGVAFEKVGFAYPSRAGVMVADGIDFKVKAGEKVAIVGPSGAGKSTLFALLVRFYDVQKGHVRIDGVDVRDMAFADLRSAIAVVAQEAAIFSTTVRANVAYGKPDASDDEIWQALKIAQADRFVREMPDGLDTAVGEKGVQLSGGQRQRLAIARAVLVDAPILLLDEATSHLDAASERAVQKALEAAGKGRTVLTIAHRLATVKAADRILVVDKGKVVEQGNHAQLMKSSKLYAALARLQMVG